MFALLQHSGDKEQHKVLVLRNVVLKQSTQQTAQRSTTLSFTFKAPCAGRDWFQAVT